MKEKILAATRAGISKVIVPEENRKDMDEIQNDLNKSTKIHYTSSMQDVLSLVLPSFRAE